MEQNKISPTNHAIKWGLILGIILIVYSLLLYFLDLTTNRALGWVSFLISIIIVVLGIKSFRDDINNGVISFSKAFGVGILICLFAGIVSSIFTYIQLSLISPELVDKMIELTEEKLLERGISEDMIETQMAISKKFMTPSMMAIMSLIWFVVFGAIVSLIVAAILKKEGDPFASSEQTLENQ